MVALLDALPSHVPLVMGASFVAYYVMLLMSRLMSPTVSTLYAAAKLNQTEWDTRIVSCIHAVVSVALVAKALWTQPESVDNIFGHYNLVEIALAITTGYLCADAVVVLLHFNTISSPTSTVIHHLTAAILFVWSMAIGVAEADAAQTILMEVSTPFVNVRWFLAVLKLESTRLYQWNGALMTLVFFACRIIPMPRLIYRLVSAAQQTYLSNAHFDFAVALVLGLTIGCALNLFWFYLMMKGVRKHLGKKIAAKSS